MEKFPTKEFVLSKIEELKILGYDCIHLPGGTAKDGSYFAGAIVYFYDEEQSKQIYFLGLPYNSSFHKENGNGHNKKSGETPDQTVTRELLEETGIQVIPSDLELILKKDVPDNRYGMSGKFHSKYFYFVNNFTGNLFTFDGPNPIDGETAAPLLIPAELFIQVLFKGHLESLKVSIIKMMEMKREYTMALFNLI